MFKPNGHFELQQPKTLFFLTFYDIGSPVVGMKSIPSLVTFYHNAMSLLP